jgi:energy-coupling factor transport system substrate-specific component
MATTAIKKTAGKSWRVVDIVVAALIAVAGGVIFWAWSQGAAAISGPMNAVYPPLTGLIAGGWMIPAVLGMLIIRKPGAALFAEMVAAGVSALLGSAWGVDTLLSGFVQGAAAELVFAFTLYRIWTFPVLAVASIASAAAAWIHDWAFYYAGFALELQLIRGVFMAISAVVIVALGSLALVRSLRRAGVLEGFPD